MTVTCRNLRCPFNAENFCQNKLMRVDANGMCEEIWRKGQPILTPAVDPSDIVKRMTEDAECRSFEAPDSDVAAYQE